MIKCIFELLIMALLAVIPGVCAIFQSVSVIPRRRENITSLVQSAISQTGPSDEPGARPLGEGPRSESTSRLAPAHYLIARGGTNRIEKDFSSQYRGSFFASASIVTVLYFAA